MPGSITASFNEPENFEAALRLEGWLSLLIIGRGQFRARLTQVTLRSMRITAAEETLSRITFMAVPADMVLLLFSIGDRPLPICGGIGLQAREILTLGPGQHVFSRTDGLSHWGAIWFSVGELIQYGSALTGTPFAIPLALQTWQPPPSTGRRLRSLHAAATG